MASASLKTIICATLVAAMVSTTPALAGKGGGGGNGGGGGGGGSHGGSGGHGGGGSHSSSSSSHGKSASSHGKSTKSSKSSKSSISSQTASATRKSSKSAKTAQLKSESLPKKALDVQPVPKPKEMASAFGKLNGFLHASPQALANAAPNSAIGLVAQGYADELGAYLAGEGDEASLADVKAALELASNKPLTAETVEVINARLATLDPEIADAIEAYDGGEKGLAEAIALADSSEIEVTEAGSLRGTVSP